MSRGTRTTSTSWNSSSIRWAATRCARHPAATRWAPPPVRGEFGQSAITARSSGANRYDTAAQIAETFFVDQIAETFFVDQSGRLAGYGAGLATGRNFPDALSATVSLALGKQPLLLTDPTPLSGPTRDFLQNHAGEGEFLDVFGGTTAVSDDAVWEATDAFSE